MFIERLDIVNACLRTMGESKLNTLEEDHTAKDDALDLVDQVLGDLLAEKKWFNVEALKLKPQATTKFIMLPEDVMEVFPLSHCGHYHVAQRGRRLYNIHKNTYEFTSPVTVTISRRLDFEQLPYIAQQYIRDEVVLRFQGSFDADNTKYVKYEGQRDYTRRLLNSEHIRQLKANPLFANGVIRSMHMRQGALAVPGPWHPHRTYPG